MNAHVLAIDDSRTIRALVSRALDAAGFNVTTAVDGDDGLTKFHSMQADLVITDVNMPKKDGFAVIDGIRQGQKNAAVPVLVLTTESGPTVKQRAREAGATGWIEKPFDDAELVGLIKRLTGA